MLTWIQEEKRTELLNDVLAKKNQLISLGVPKLMENGNKKTLFNIARNTELPRLFTEFKELPLYFMPSELEMNSKEDVMAMAFICYLSPIPMGEYGLFDRVKFLEVLELAGTWGTSLADCLNRGYVLSYRSYEDFGKRVNGLTFNQFLHPERAT